jgi:hypothetical protein
MVNRCANRRCDETFQRMGDGKLFLDDGRATGSGSEELVNNSYWLCAKCAREYTISFTEAGALLVSTATGHEELVA